MTSETPHILVIDDDEGITDMLSKMLGKKGYRVATAHSVEEGLDFLETSSCDLVISDIFMPGMGGIEGIKRVRELRPDLRIIAMSGGWTDMAAETTVEAARKIGADALLQKPFRASRVHEAVSEVMAREPARQSPAD